MKIVRRNVQLFDASLQIPQAPQRYTCLVSAFLYGEEEERKIGHFSAHRLRRAQKGLVRTSDREKTVRFKKID